jgi:DTW domain-containing protein YfiP
MTRKPFLFVVKQDGSLEDKAKQAQIKSQLKGVILLDGTWSQAKTLWWRNAWLLKCPRLILSPKSNSLYGELRKEPRKECLSTIETVADTLEALGESESQSLHLKFLFAELLKKYSYSVQASSGALPT